MARPESQQIAGYFPTPPHLIPSFASTLRWPLEPQRERILLDPCAGDGAAIRALRAAWCPEHASWRLPSIVACELEAERAQTLRRMGEEQDVAFHGDAFHLVREPTCSGAALLYLNPPYDTDPEHGRSEQRFLARFTPWLRRGAGWLMYLVPHYALEASAELLAREYVDLCCWRLPEEDFAAYRQVLLVGRRAPAPCDPCWQRDRVLGWAREPEDLALVTDQLHVHRQSLAVDPERDFSVQAKLEAPDLAAALHSFQPWQGSRSGLLQPVGELLGAKVETALPPKPAHIALALSTGLFNGHRLEANDRDRDPAILVKGVFRRHLKTVSTSQDEDGNLTSAIEVERPVLELQMLRLDTFTFHTLRPGLVPTGEEDPAEWNAADLISRYDRSLAEVLAQQFPPLHDPRNPAHQLALPELARRPFAVQAQAIQTALKLLASGQTPFFVAEVGTGKSTMALSVAAALSPAHHAATRAELRRLGFDGEVPLFRRTVVFCPPHLLDSWREQVAAVLPEARVVVLSRPADLEEEADFYLLSRETAKLGHGYRGVSKGRCPKCTRPLEADPAQLAKGRERCTGRRPRPGRPLAHLAEHLAAVLAPVFPDKPQVMSLAPARVLARKRTGSLTPALLDGLASHACRVAIGQLRARLAGPEVYPVALCRVLDVLKHALIGTETSKRCRRFLAKLCESVPAERKLLREHLGRFLTETEPLESLTNEARAGKLLTSLEDLAESLADEGSALCGEPLYQAVPEPRRFPLARLIQRRWKGDFLLLIDEAHEANQAGSAQSKAAHRLAQLPGVRTLVLTGSLMGGYSSSLFANFWHLSRRFRQEFERDELEAFTRRYGYRKLLTTYGRKKGDAGERGAVTDRELSRSEVIGEAPGLHPAFLTRHLLPTAILVHKDDLEAELPTLTERPVPIAFPEQDPLAQELEDEYRGLQEMLLAQIKQDRFRAGLAGRLLGALVELPSYLDRATEDQGTFLVGYPADLGGRVLGYGRQFPSDWRTPKERWLIERVRQAVEAGEKVLLFLRHTGDSRLPDRLLRLLAPVTEKAAWLDAKKVPTHQRQRWIQANVIEKNLDVLIVNPNAVRTGLNNLVAFSVGLWYELDTATTTYRQANGRLHRIGQEKPVTIEIPYYADTAQEVTFDLVAKKVSVSTQVDGLDLAGALEAAGASEDEAGGIAAAMSLGEAVWRRLGGGEAVIA
ncbi:MAG TPA: DUF6094 domain-containing protein [Thermoanaerobaculia bacterium]|nr:DUF6094 domain-containing protein [Thermoanaerobaculia bacterium]